MSVDPMDDQYRAAVKHAEHIVAASGSGSGPKVIGPRGWVKNMVDIFMIYYLQNAQGCGHLQNPQPVFGAMREMGVLRCGPCFDAYSAAETWSTCDRCGTNSDEVSGSALTLGPTVLMLRLCTACTAAALAEQE